jgi:hypothetical protein
MNRWYHLAVVGGVLLAATCARAWTGEEVQQIDAVLQARVPGWTRAHTDSLVARSQKVAILDASLVTGPDSPKVLVIDGKTILVNGQDITANLGKQVEPQGKAGVPGSDTAPNQAAGDPIAPPGDAAHAGSGDNETGSGGVLVGAGAIGALCAAVGGILYWRRQRKTAV